MGDDQKERLEPGFGDWTLNEVKDSVFQAITNCLKRSGFRGLAVLLVILSLAWIASLIVSNPVEGSNKQNCLLGFGGALLLMGLAALLTEKADNGTAYQNGRDSENQHRAIPGDEGPPGAAPKGD